MSARLFSTLSRLASSVLLCCVLVSVAFGQGKKTEDKTWNLPNYDSKPLHYGFILGIHQATFKLNYSQHFNENGDSTIALLPKRTLSNFAIGMIIDIPFGENQWDFRFTPMVGLYEYSVVHKQLNRSTGAYEDTDVPVESVFFEFPILMKYKSLRRNNNRFYLVGGMVPSIKVGGRKQRDNREVFGMEDYNLEMTYGIGLDHYFSFFKFAPELRLSHGIANMNLRNQSVYFQNIERLNTNKVSLLLHFE